jgi:hypothetical protein
MDRTLVTSAFWADPFTCDATEPRYCVTNARGDEDPTLALLDVLTSRNRRAPQIAARMKASGLRYNPIHDEDDIGTLITIECLGDLKVIESLALFLEHRRYQSWSYDRSVPEAVRSLRIPPRRP